MRGTLVRTRGLKTRIEVHARPGGGGGYYAALRTGIILGNGSETMSYAMASHIAEYLCPPVDIGTDAWSAGSEIILSGPVTTRPELARGSGSLLRRAFAISRAALVSCSQCEPHTESLSRLAEGYARARDTTMAKPPLTNAHAIPHACRASFAHDRLSGSGISAERLRLAFSDYGFRGMGLVEIAGQPRLIEIDCDAVLGLRAFVRLLGPSADSARALPTALKVAAVARRNPEWGIVRADMLDGEVRLAMPKHEPARSRRIPRFMEAAGLFLERYEDALVGISSNPN